MSRGETAEHLAKLRRARFVIEGYLRGAKIKTTEHGKKLPLADRIQLLEARIYYLEAVVEHKDTGRCLGL